MEQNTLERPAEADQPEAAMTTLPLPPETRAVLALNSSKTEFDLRALAIKHVTIVEIKDRAGREQAHGAAMELMRARTDIEKVSKTARDDATKFSKAVIAEEKRLVAIVEDEEKRLKGLRDDWDDAEQKRREAAAAAERARVLAITTRIAEINQKAILAGQCRTADAIQRLIDALEKVDMTGFDEYEQEAKTARSTAIGAMAALRNAKRAEEEERARIKAEQEAEAARLAEERATIARQKAEAEAEAAKAKEKQEAEAAELQRQREAFAAEQAAARAAQQAEADRLQAKADELASQCAELQSKQEVPSVDRSSDAIETEAAHIPDAGNIVAGPALEPDSDVAEVLQKDTPPFAEKLAQGDVSCLPVCMNLPETTKPSDADVIWTAAAAVADAYGWTTADAINRLAAIDWQPY